MVIFKTYVMKMLQKTGTRWAETVFAGFEPSSTSFFVKSSRVMIHI